MSGPLFGTETEYAVVAGAGDRAANARDEAVGRMLDRVRDSLPNLPAASGSGFFLANGSRFYVDQGCHPEVSSPEVSNPFDAVRYSRAGDAMMLELAHSVARGGRSSPVLILKNNVDLMSGSTWGSHESYGHRSRLDRLAPLLVPHLVSRVIYAGAGGFSTQRGFAFSVSPRANFLGAVMSDSSTSDRAIVHVRDEPLAGNGHQRLHLICGESLHSDVGMFLRVGTTALVVAMIDNGRSLGAAVAPARPVSALQAFSADVECRTAVQTASGRLTAIEIQRHYLEQVEGCIGQPWLPEWAGIVCQHWREMLGRLDRGYREVARSLDWAIRYTAFSEYLRKMGCSWGELMAWAASGTQRALDANVPPSNADFDPSQAPKYAALRAALIELDLRCAQLGPGGIIAQLDAAGHLDHRVAGIDRIDAAINEPPSSGRARVRGGFIAREAGSRDRFACTWDRAFDRSTGRMLDLSDAFADEERWIDIPEETDREPNAFDAIQMNGLALAHRDAGRLEQAEELLRWAVALELRVLGERHAKIPHRLNNLAMVLVMRGPYVEARDLLVGAWQLQNPREDITGARILFVRLALALIEREPTAGLIGQLKTVLSAWPIGNVAVVDGEWNVVSVLQYLRSQVPPGSGRLLTALVSAFNDESLIGRLDQVTAWRGQPCVPLDAEW